MPAIKTTRRGFMQLSATSAAMLTVGASISSLSGCTKVPAATGYKILRPGDLEFLKALAPVILSNGYPGPLGAEAEERLLRSLDRLIGTLQEYARSQLILMLDIMQYPPIRIFAGARWKTWSEMSHEEVEAFLNEWKFSMIQLKRMGYGSLCKLFSMCWYREPENFILSGYPGMPKHIVG